jgi:hypothetical protein
VTLNRLSSSNSLTLEAVKVQFDHWRETRVKGNKIPKYLWDALINLTNQYSYKQIASELKINPYRLRSKIEKQSQQVPSLEKPDFVEIPLFSFPNSSPLEPRTFCPHSYAQGTIEFTRPDGTILKASGLNNDHMCSLIKSFLGQ